MSQISRNLLVVTPDPQEQPSSQISGMNYRVLGSIFFKTTFYRAMSRDEARYPNPEEFIPERFLDSEGVLTDDDPTHFIFGFGRRICPGKPAPSSCPRESGGSHTGYFLLSRPMDCGCFGLECRCNDAGHAGFQPAQRRKRKGH